MYRLLVVAAVLALANGQASIIEPRVIGGVQSNIESYPYMLSVKVFGNHFCGGAILTRKHFVTAARCLTTLPNLPFYYKVRVGSTSKDKGGQLIVVEKCVQHPNHRTFDHYYDVAIGTLQKPLDFQATMQPITLIKANDVFKIGESFTVTGWGPTSMTTVSNQTRMDKDAENLYTARVQYADRQECRLYQRANLKEPPVYTWITVNSSLICAGGASRTLYGTDAGAPLVNNKKQLVGIATRTQDITNLRWPSLYANVAHPTINKFITDNIQYP